VSELPHYSMVIAWSEEDLAYLVSLPEWTARAHMPITHGGTYQEAAQRGQHALESLIEQALEDGKPLPTPAAARHGVA
jgi:antitoxin HicB